MEQLLVSDGTDNATLTKKNLGETEKHINTWLLELKILETNEERSRRMLEAAAQTISISGGGNIEYWVEMQTRATMLCRFPQVTHLFAI